MLVPMMRDSHEPRSITVLRHVQAYLLGTAVSVQSYADDVRCRYQERTPARQQSLRFHTDGDVAEDFKANGQLVGRILDRTVRMPVDIEEALILALPEEEQRRCWVDLAARVGRLSVAHPEDGVEGLTADLGRFISDFGQLTQAFVPLLRDLQIDEHAGREDLECALDRLRQLMAGAQSFIEVVCRALAGQGRS